MTALPVIVVHAAPGDPKRARAEFAAILGDAPHAIATVGGEVELAEQLLAFHARARTPLLVLPWLIAHGGHMEHDVLPALAHARERGVSIIEGTLFGESAAFDDALCESLSIHAVALTGLPMASVAWFAPGGAAVGRAIREKLPRVKPDWAGVAQTWSRASVAGDVGRLAFPLIAVLREGTLSQRINAAWRGPVVPRLMLTPSALRAGTCRWVAEELAATTATTAVATTTARPAMAIA